jgi:hypothetical protein
MQAHIHAYHAQLALHSMLSDIHAIARLPYLLLAQTQPHSGMALDAYRAISLSTGTMTTTDVNTAQQAPTMISVLKDA